MIFQDILDQLKKELPQAEFSVKVEGSKEVLECYLDSLLVVELFQSSSIARIGASNEDRLFYFDVLHKDCIISDFLRLVRNPLKSMIEHHQVNYAFSRLRTCHREEFFPLLHQVFLTKANSSRPRPSQWPNVIMLIAVTLHRFSKKEFDDEWEKITRAIYIAEQFK